MQWEHRIKWDLGDGWWTGPFGTKYRLDSLGIRLKNVYQTWTTWTLTAKSLRSETNTDWLN